jgi:PST family polysaccharide transporter
VKLLRNYLSLAAAEVISKLVTFAAFVYLARVLGPDNFGYVEFAGAVLLCASLIVDQGFGMYGAREIAKAPGSTRALVFEVVASRFILAAGAYAAVASMAAILDKPPIVARLLIIYGLSLLVMPLLLQWVFQGHEQMHSVAIIQVIRQSVFAIVVFIFVRGAEQIWMVAAAEVAGVCAASLYGVWVYWRRFGNPFPRRLNVSARLLRQAVPIGLSQMFWVVKMFGATVIIGLIATAEDTGYFAAAMRILIALHTFVWLYHFNLLPSLARAWQQGGGEFTGLISRSMHIVAWSGAATVLIWVSLAPTVIRASYGPAFSPAGSTLQWLAGVCVLAAVNGHYRFGLVAAGRQNIEMLASAIGAAAAIICIPLGYSKAGPEGAAMGLVVVELIVLLITWWCSYRLLGTGGHAKLLMRVLLASAFASALVWVLPLYSQTLRTLAALSILIAAALFDSTVREYLRQFGVARRRRYGPPLPENVREVTQ